MTTLPRIATAGELVKLRSDNQSSRLYLSVHSPATVYTARLAAVPSSTDKVASITYNTGSGTLANVLQDMTILVGSTAGASDVGIARIRKDGTTTAGTLYIGETSEINWTSNAYLTVLDSFELWPRHVNIDTDGTTPLMDYDVAYTDQNQAAGSIPTPIMGSHAVLWLRGASVTYSPDASSSWVNGGTITDYLWECATADSITNDTTATPTFTFDTAGTHRIALTVTGDNGVTFTGYRYVFVVTETSGVTTQFTLDSCAGDYDTGGWAYRVTLYDEATKALIRDRALCVLHSVDYYGDTLGSVGYVAGAENVLAVGWIAGESVTWASEDKSGTVAFDVQGPHYWLGQMTAFPSGVKDVSDSTTPNKWTKFRGLTLNKAWYHFMRWRCTATRCIDVYPIDDTRRIKRLESPGGQNIWAQLIEISRRSILAEPCADRYGRLFLQINHQYVTDRSSMPTVQAITSSDWRDSITLDRMTVDTTSLVDLSGMAWDGTTPTAYFSLAPGHVFNHYGAVEVVDRLALIDQSTSNTLAGLYSARKNNAYPKVDIPLASHHRLIDIAPYQRVTLAVSSSDTPRGITESFTLIPRSVSYGYQDGYILTDVSCESEVTADLAVTGDTPPNPPDPPVIPIDPPPDPLPIDDALSSDAREVWLANSTQIFYSVDYFNGGQPTWAVAGIPAGHISIDDFQIAVDGSTAYCRAYDGAATRIFKTTNPRTASPTWTDITLSNWIYQSVLVWGNYFIAHLMSASGPLTHRYYEYNGTSGTIIDTLEPMSDNNEVSYRAYHSVTGTPAVFRLFRTSTDTQIGTDIQYILADIPWINLNQSAYYTVLTNTPDNSKIYKINTTTMLYDTGSAMPIRTNFIGKALRGAYSGSHLYLVDATARLLAAPDGATFAPIATWLAGVVEDAKRAGGGSLVWLPRTVTANNVPTRLYTQTGAVLRDMTGNFWSVATGDQTFINLALVF